jgi:hypothetical protein
VTIVYQTDSKKNIYQVWAQEQANSCAVASIWMARCQARQMTFAEDEWELAWRLYQHAVVGLPWAMTSSASAPTGPVSIDPSAYTANQSSFYNMFGSFGTFAAQVAKVLRSNGLKVTHVPSSGTAQSLNTAKLSQRSPAIVLLGWYQTQNGQNVRTGGHFVVAADHIGNRIVYLDPWGGQLYEFANNARYKANGLIEEVIYLTA